MYFFFFVGTGLVGSWINGHGHPFPIPILVLPIWPYLIDSYFQRYIYTQKKVMPTCCAIKTMSWHTHFASGWNFALTRVTGGYSLASSFAETPGTKTKQKLILFLTTWQSRIEKRKSLDVDTWRSLALPTNVYSFWPFVFVFFRLWFRNGFTLLYFTLLYLLTWLGLTKTQSPVVLSVSWSPWLCNAITTRIFGRKKQHEKRLSDWLRVC